MGDKLRGDDPKKDTIGESVTDYARREMEEVAEREKKKQAYLEAQKRIAAEIPARFMKLAEKIRAEVDAFNKIVDGSRRISLVESAGLAAKADPTKAELNMTISRKQCEAWVGFSELMRLGRAPTAYIIEAHVKLSQAKVRVRCEGVPKDKDIRYRVTIDMVEPPFGLDELGSRIVLAVAKDDPAILGAAAGPV